MTKYVRPASLKGDILHWNQGFSYYYPQVAQVINQARKPLILTDTKTGRILTLSHLINLKVRFKTKPLCRSCRFKTSSGSLKNLLDISPDFSNVFLLSPSQKLRDRIGKKYKIKSAHVAGEPWRLEH